MQSYDAIIHLAKEEARHFRPLRDDEVHAKLPYFKLSKQGGAQYKAEVFNHVGHENENRLPWFVSYMMNEVVQHVDTNINISGCYQMELHDTYAYLNNEHDYTNTLVWSKRKSDNHVVLLPDMYHLSGFSNRFDKMRDTVSFAEKLSKVAFFGTTTGSLDPTKNTRIQMCRWAQKHRDFTDVYITRIAQIPIAKIVEAVPEFNDICCPPVPESHMYKYRYCLDIPGNTCSWDRVPAVMNSNSLLFKMPCDDMCWYYPLLHAGTHYVSCNTHDMLSKFTYYQNNRKDVKFITDNAQHFVKQFMHKKHALMYTVALFEEAAQRNGK